MTMARTVTVTLGPHEEEVKMAAFCAAIDEGDASPDVMDFNEEAFIAEMKEGWRAKNG